MRVQLSPKNIEEVISQLAHLTLEELVRQWIKNYGHRPPKGLGRGILELSAAYNLQAKIHGSLKLACRKAPLEPTGKVGLDAMADP